MYGSSLSFKCPTFQTWVSWSYLACSICFRAMGPYDGNVSVSQGEQEMTYGLACQWWGGGRLPKSAMTHSQRYQVMKMAIDSGQTTTSIARMPTEKMCPKKLKRIESGQCEIAKYTRLWVCDDSLCPTFCLSHLKTHMICMRVRSFWPNCQLINRKDDA